MSTQHNKILVSDVMLSVNDFPIVSEKTILKETLEQMDNYHLGISCIVDNNTHLLGILTDGDIRRKLLSVQKPLSAFFIDDALIHAIIKPITVPPDILLIEAINLMGDKKVWDLPVVDNDKLIGLLHLHPAIKRLISH